MDVRKILVLALTAALLLVLLVFCKVLDGRSLPVSPTEPRETAPLETTEQDRKSVV